ncbi:threonine/serine exporter family protein [Microbacterium radiodurans]|uniref:Threonine/serine exporter family protein n=1 Tax=Microbacterium radiodurans TaxID=661398 RepID=A0A5J5IQU0_9MICO|nr:threonine/serine exporter family protein [Microbacterium radiodurans]KAA9085255.1 threonine/serine exporter family protein [Microbacterium radiodurans]
MTRRRLFSSLQSLVHVGDPALPPTEQLPVLDDAFAVRVVEFAIRVGETMLVAGASASDVTSTIVRVSAIYGIDPVHVDVTYNSITVAHHRSGDDRPITLMRVVRGAIPDHARLQRIQALVTDVRGGLSLDAATVRFRMIRRTPFRYRPPVVVASQALLAVGVAVMFGGNWLVLVLSFLAAGLASVTQFALSRARVPFFFSQIAGAFVLTLAAAAAPLLATTGWEAAQSVRPSVIVASGIVLMLAGLTVVGAAQDAIDGFALTAMGRILELITQTLGVVVGILAGLETARVLGVGMQAPSAALPLGPLPLQFAGAALIAIAVALFNGAGMRIVAVSTGLSVIAWTGYVAASSIGFDVAAASGVGAFAGSIVGIIAAYRLHVPSVAITTAAILPMVPGAAVFRGLLGVVEAGDSTAVLMTGFTTLASAATIGISLAVGASLGIYLGQPLRASLSSVTRARARMR